MTSGWMEGQHAISRAVHDGLMPAGHAHLAGLACGVPRSATRNQVAHYLGMRRAVILYLATPPRRCATRRFMNTSDQDESERGSCSVGVACRVEGDAWVL